MPTLDLIITRTSDKLINDSPRIDCYLSDHALVLCSLNSNRPALKTQKVTYRRLKAINIINLNKDLADSSLCYDSPDDVDHLAECYDATLASVINKHAPLKSKVIVERPRVPWFNDEIKEAKGKHRKAERKWRRSKSTIDLDNFKQSRNTVNHILFKARQDFYSDLIDEHSGDQKKLLRTTMNLLNRAGTQRLPLVPGSIMFANNIANYFIGKIENIRKKLDAIPGLSSGSDKSPENISTMTEFNILTEDVITLIKNSSLKSCPLDPMPSRLVSECSSLLPVLTKIINSSLQNGHFPKTWKDAMVFPLLKKIGVDFALDNLRPVSNLKFVSKLTEMAACNQVHVSCISQQPLSKPTIVIPKGSQYRNCFT